MKSVILAILSFLFLNVTISYAQIAATPTPIPILTQVPFIGDQPIPGENCGTLTAPNNKCCYYRIQNVVAMPTTGNGLVDAALSTVNTIIEKVIRPVTNPLNEMAQNVIQPCIEGEPSTKGHPEDNACVCQKATLPALTALSPLCNSVNEGERGSCNKCLKDGGVWTAATCVYASVQSFIEKTLLSWGIGLAGIVSLLCIIYSTLMMQTSQGSPEKIKKAQEMLTSCIMGLMLIIFSIFILRIIGVNILLIPGFK